MRLFTEDVLMNVSKLEEFCRANLGNFTFDVSVACTGVGEYGYVLSFDSR